VRLDIGRKTVKILLPKLFTPAYIHSKNVYYKEYRGIDAESILGPIEKPVSHFFLWEGERGGLSGVLG
jgi:hypothetical protein